MHTCRFRGFAIESNRMLTPAWVCATFDQAIGKVSIRLWTAAQRLRGFLTSG